MLLLNKINIKDLYFVVYKTNDVNLLTLLNNTTNLFFDVFMTSDHKIIPYFIQDQIEKIIPAKFIIDLYHKLEKSNKDCVIFSPEEYLLINEEDLNDFFEYSVYPKINKKQLENFILLLKMIKEGKIEPVYLPSLDKEKELSFVS